MTKNINNLSIGLLLVSISLFAAEQTPIVDPQTGIVNEYMQLQLKTVGLLPQSYHIKDVDALLQERCFQRNYDLFRDGGTSNFDITPKQAVQSLELEYAQHKDTLPKEKVEADVIIPMGVTTDVALKKRILILSKLKALKYPLAKIHFCGKKELSEPLPQEIESVPWDVVISDEEMDILEGCLHKLKLQTNYLYVVADEPLGRKMSEVVKVWSEGKGINTLGYASFPETDYQNDIQAYGYNNEHLPTKEEQAVAFCKSSWNFHARSIHTAFVHWQKNQKDKS